MRLVSAVRRLERAVQGRKQAEERRGHAWGLVWSSEEREPQEGEVCDIVTQPAEEGVPERWTYRPRTARGPDDLGDVVDAGGVVIGRVVRRDGSVIDIELAASPSLGAVKSTPAWRGAARRASGQ